MKRVILALLMPVLASGCQSTMSPELAAQADDAACVSYGYVRGDRYYATCRMHAANSREQRVVAQNQAVAAAVLGAVVVGAAAVAASQGPYYHRPYYCGRYRCYW
ncbi:Hox protein A13 N terminal [Mesorhizobium albiziae]|uniref:Hox protein A13 N terminal n=1 Tax=Neomesorhizobium albiziae TaxID=335020 RepID=A0A1I4FY50_9HYPH|nr:Hox protein A13 N terminal [Mesorhizobium albiziae]